VPRTNLGGVRLGQGVFAADPERKRGVLGRHCNGTALCCAATAAPITLTRLPQKAKGTLDSFDTKKAVEQIRGRQAFHEFVLSGNEPSLRQYYEANRTEESQMISGANVACIGSATSVLAWKPECYTELDIKREGSDGSGLHR
jgi:hypothetical protein